ncbi:MAG: hypothetical protein WBH68_03570 [Erysipelotrichaceae bacterium]|jgi:hypothetical protein|nr:hypothetical protein [Bacillota bacterium]
MIGAIEISRWVVFTIIIILLIINFEVSFRKEYKEKKEFYERKNK